MHTMHKSNEAHDIQRMQNKSIALIEIPNTSKSPSENFLLHF